MPTNERASKPLLGRGQASDEQDVHDDKFAVVVLNIDGMACAACAAAIEGGLASLNGVACASVSVMGRSGRVRYDPSSVDVPRLIACVESAGFKAEVQAADISTYMAKATASSEVDTSSWLRRFLGSMLFTLPVFLMSMVFKQLPGTSAVLTREVVPGLSIFSLSSGLLSTVVLFGFGYPFHRGALKALRACHFNMDVLVSLASAAAYLHSLIFLLLSLATRGGEGADTSSFSTATTLITFILLGKFLESTAKQRASSAISRLLTLQPPTALQLERCDGLPTDERGEAKEVLVSSLRRGDVVKVLPGAKVRATSDEREEGGG